MEKVSRQLILFHIFFCCTVVEWIEITNLIEVSRRTILRDINDLKNAGLINIRYSSRQKGYVHVDYKNSCPFLAPVYGDNKKENMHLDKLIRLATIMMGLRDHIEEPYDPYDPYQVKDQETCSSWYKKQFPHISTRTMQRDFKQLNMIGYDISYDREQGCYTVNFPEYLDGIIGGL